MGRQEPILTLQESLGLGTEELIFWFAIQNEKANSFPEYRKMTVLSPSASTPQLYVFCFPTAVLWAPEVQLMSDAVLNHTESAGVSRHQSCLQTTSASHHSFSRLVKSQVQQSLLLFFHLSSAIPADTATSCWAAQPCILSLAYRKAGRWRITVFWALPRQ